MGWFGGSGSATEDDLDDQGVRGSRLDVEDDHDLRDPSQLATPELAHDRCRGRPRTASNAFRTTIRLGAEVLRIQAVPSSLRTLPRRFRSGLATNWPAFSCRAVSAVNTVLVQRPLTTDQVDKGIARKNGVFAVIAQAAESLGCDANATASLLFENRQQKSELA